MIPSLPANNLSDRLGTHPKSFGELGVRNLFSFKQASYFTHAFICKLSAKMFLPFGLIWSQCSRVFRALRLPVPFNSVVRIVLGSPEQQVRGPETYSNVANVSNLKSFRNFSMRPKPSKAMDQPLLVVNGRDPVPDSVSVILACASPQPAVSKMLGMLRRWSRVEFLPEDFRRGCLSPILLWDYLVARHRSKSSDSRGVGRASESATEKAGCKLNVFTDISAVLSRALTPSTV